jgi:hypothetical protein
MSPQTPSSTTTPIRGAPGSGAPRCRVRLTPTTTSRRCTAASDASARRAAWRSRSTATAARSAHRSSGFRAAGGSFCRLRLPSRHRAGLAAFLIAASATAFAKAHQAHHFRALKMPSNFRTITLSSTRSTPCSRCQPRPGDELGVNRLGAVRLCLHRDRRLGPCHDPRGHAHRASRARLIPISAVHGTDRERVAGARGAVPNRADAEQGGGRRGGTRRRRRRARARLGGAEVIVQPEPHELASTALPARSRVAAQMSDADSA